MGLFNFKSSAEKQLDGLIQKMEMNLSNNYKDNAQSDLKKLEETLAEMKATGTLKETVQAKYESIMETYRQRLKGYSHKDQKPYWH
ncbi:MAG: hypothetical protein K5697_04140 [Lachnospiraceae bacterium]|nr:hypothetical protein [Lachnospiraceae bacterium]